ncbi:isoaspartyl peptidase/L-asparaginase family protein [Vineibacter terrae]|uniref:isoaspartyl peptidase/L-asparaginase family protein n=1 Tax=Vineibacter terrae TaxID=2586908 RepID=UPI002E36DEA5|nr:isoaspartyl peptidase/L-asparaginase [Vineibacter terrae]HEX2888787.1 isoaspartyl peptidase/L-asparaginase [Vineibacter terrae]
MPSPVIAVHGGCGTLAADLQSAADWAETRAHLAAALRAAWRILAAGGAALDAVEAAVVVLEDSPHFNAGHGAALTEDAAHELDASIMDGATLAAGAVCTVRTIRNPVRAARAVMERSDCVLLSGAAADAFAQAHGLACVGNDYFTTERRVKALAALKARAARGTIALASEAERHGTVGAVALDRDGRLAAATSTGGFNNKPAGRVGDTPVIGAGTYARNGVCAVSCTGQGEVFMRRVAAYDVAARMSYAGQTLRRATDALVLDVLSSHRIGAGLVAVDAAGNVVAPFNTLGMARGWIAADGVLKVATHKDVIDMGVA